MTGAPKPVLGPLAQVLAPVAVWTTDEGQSGLRVHVANDRREALDATVRVTLYRDLEHVVETASAAVSVAPHGTWDADVEALLGRWLDASYAYRFGPPQHDLVVTALETADGSLLQSHARFPAGRPAGAWAAEELGLEVATGDGTVTLSARRALVGTRLSGPGLTPATDGFLVEPGRPRTVTVPEVRPGDEVVVIATTLLGIAPVRNGQPSRDPAGASRRR